MDHTWTFIYCRSCIVLALSFAALTSCIGSDSPNFKRVGSMSQALIGPTTILLKDNSVLVLSPCQGAELYNPETKVFKPLKHVEIGHNVNGHVTFNGIEPSSLFDSALIDYVAQIPSSSLKRAGFSRTLLPSGLVLIIGGDAEQVISTDIEIYNPKTKELRHIGRLCYPRSGHQATLLSNGDIVVTGGSPDGIPAEIIDGKSLIARSLDTTLASRMHHTAIRLKDDRILLIGGDRYPASQERDVEIFEPSQDKCAPMGPLNEDRALAAAAVLPDGSVLIAGGRPITVTDFDWLRSAETYNPQIQEKK